MLKATSCLAALAAVVLLSLVPAWGARTAPLADLYLVLVAEPALSDALDARLQAVAQCKAGKDEVTRELIAGRISLAEAADRFERLDARRDEGQEVAQPASRAE